MYRSLAASLILHETSEVVFVLDNIATEQTFEAMTANGIVFIPPLDQAAVFAFHTWGFIIHNQLHYRVYIIP
jgi:hypothetical protein